MTGMAVADRVRGRGQDLADGNRLRDQQELRRNILSPAATIADEFAASKPPARVFSRALEQVRFLFAASVQGRALTPARPASE